MPRYTTEIITEYEDEDGEARSICELPFAHHDDENEANAKLIAAAPELLEALKQMVSIVVIHSNATGNNFAWAELDEARAAIAKCQ